MGGVSKSRASVGAAAAVLTLLIGACVLPEVETGSLGTGMVNGEPQVAARPETSPPTETATPSAPSPMDAAWPMNNQETNVGQSSEASASSGDASLGVDAAQGAQDSGTAISQTPPAADSGTDTRDPAACSCQVKNECCDGCRPSNEGGSCKDDGNGCTIELCRAGACVREDRTDACYADGLCHKAGDEHFTNRCMVCNPSRNHKGWSPREFGFPCSDNNPCNGDDFCGAASQAGVCVHTGDPCAGSGGTCDSMGMCTYPN